MSEVRGNNINMRALSLFIIALCSLFVNANEKMNKNKILYTGK